MPDHLGRNRRLVDEDEARRIKLGLLDLQRSTRRTVIIAIPAFIAAGRVRGYIAPATLPVSIGA